MFDTERIYIVTGNIEEHRCPSHPATQIDPACCEGCEVLGEKLTAHLETLLEGEGFEVEEIDFSPGRVKKELESLRGWLYENYPEVLVRYASRDIVSQPASRPTLSVSIREGGIPIVSLS